MAKNPLVNVELRQYLERHDLESTIHTIINTVVKETPGDPYAALANLALQYSNSEAQLSHFIATEILNGQGKPTLQVEVFCIHKEQLTSRGTFSYSFNDGHQMQFLDPQAEGEEAAIIAYPGEGMGRAAEFINTRVNEMLKHMVLSEVALFESAFKKNMEDFETRTPFGVNITSSCISALFKANASVLQMEPYEFVYGLSSPSSGDDPIITPPRIMINFLTGGKSVNSKLKYKKFYIIPSVELTVSKPHLIKSIIQIHANFRKLLASSKMGEAGVKLHSDGSFIAVAIESVNDAIKNLTEAINQAGLTPGKDVSLGLNIDGDSFYNAESKKYELEPPKGIFDSTGASDYFLKTINENSIIEVVEDPMATVDTEGWKMFTQKLADKPNVKIMASKAISSQLANFQHLVELVSKDEDSDNEDQQREEEDGEEKEEADQDKDAKSTTSKKTTDDDPNKNKLNPQIVMVDPHVNGFHCDVIAMTKTMKRQGGNVCIKDSDYGTAEAFLVDFAVGVQAEFLLLAPPVGFERIAKYNRYSQLLEDMRNKECLIQAEQIFSRPTSLSFEFS